MSETKGKFITFEGIDASGKTTNIPILAEHLRERGYKVVTTREPGGSHIGPKVRDILLHGGAMDKVTELLLFLAERNEHVQKFIRPHLAAGHIVICDRFHDSTWAYQGFGRGMTAELDKLGYFVHGGLVPDHTLFFNLPFEESVRRLALRSDKQDRLDQEEESFRRKVYEGYQARLFSFESKYLGYNTTRKIHQIDALPEPDVVSASVKAWANTVFENLN